MMELWPFTNFHDLNLDWIIKTILDWVKKMQNFVAEMTADWKDMQDDWQEFIDSTYKDQITEILEDHPEWVTTVMDGAITYAKLHETLRFFVTPEHFGGVGDGVTDDTVAVQTALNTGKPVIFCKNKIYKITEVFVPDNTMMLGGGTINCGTRIHIDSNNIIMRNLIITSDDHNVLVSSYSAGNPSNKNITLEDVSFIYNAADGTEITANFDYVEKLTLTNCTMKSGGINLRHVIDVNIYGLYYDGEYLNDNEAIHLSVYTENVNIESCTFKNLKMEAIDTFSSGSRVNIINNIFDGFNMTAIDVKTVLRDPPYTDGSSDQPKYGYTEFINIDNNIFRNLIPVTNNARSSVIQCTVQDLKQSPGHSLDNECKYITITNNSFSEMYPQDSRLQAVNARYSCVYIRGSGILVSGNTFTQLYVNSANTETSAIRIGDFTINSGYVDPENIVISDNIISGNSEGIIVSSSKKVSIRGNSILKDGRYNTACQYGIMLLNTVVQAVISGNVIECADTGEPIFSQIGAKQNEVIIHDNILNRNAAGVGIRLFNAFGCVISGNIIKNGSINMSGTSSANGELNTISGNHFSATETVSYALFSYNNVGVLVIGNSVDGYPTFVRFLNDSRFCTVINNMLKNCSTILNKNSVTADYQSTVTESNNTTY